jgi:hypothetical protein
MRRRKSRWVKDAFGEWCEISEFWGTKHGFDLILGWPAQSLISSSPDYSFLAFELY